MKMVVGHLVCARAQKYLLLAGLLLPLTSVLGACARDGAEGRHEPTTETLRLRSGGTTIYREGALYAFRRNDWSFYGFARARAEAAAPAPAGRTTIVHFDAHSDMHPAPVAGDSVGVIGGNLASLERYTDRLSVSTFMMPCLYYGLADEIYWVQPEISCYQGAAESVAFDLEARDGWILPRIRAGASPVDREALAMRAHQGLPVSRMDDLVAVTRHRTEDWVTGPLRLHCLSREQFAERVRAGALAGREVLVDLDLDYFGTSGEMRGYGYLALPRRGQVAVGLLGGTLPVFYLAPDRRREEMAAVARLIDRISPVATCLCESPDHAHRDQIPAMAGFFRRALRGSSPADIAPAASEREGAGGGPGAGLRVHLHTATGRHELTPACPRRVDLGGADTLLAELAWRAPRDSVEVSVYFNPSGSEDRLVTRWHVRPARVPATWPLVAGPADWTGYLGQGWELEIRDLRRGQLLFSAAFALDDGLVGLRAAVARLGEADFAGAEGFDAGRVAAALDPAEIAQLPPSQVIDLGRALGLPPGPVHRLILAHPQSLAWQCENLRGYRAGPGTVR